VKATGHQEAQEIKTNEIEDRYSNDKLLDKFKVLKLSFLNKYILRILTKWMALITEICIQNM